MLKLTTDKHEASRNLSATAELLVVLVVLQSVKIYILYSISITFTSTFTFTLAVSINKSRHSTEANVTAINFV